MRHGYPHTLLLVLIFLLNSSIGFAGDTPCTATPLPNNMTSFQTYSNLGNTDSGVENPGCGNYITADIWFSVSAPGNGLLDIVTLGGGLFNGAMAFYEGSCNDLNLLSCMDDDNCGNSIMPIMSWNNLTPGATYYIRIWAENGAPNGDFQIRVSNGPLPIPPVPTTSLVGTAFLTNINGLDCVQLTTTNTGQAGCAWDPTQINMSQAFDETFNFNFGNSDAGADGICWVFQNNPSGPGTCGNTGQQIAANFTNSFIIEMDTYDNGPGFGDIAQDHISINVNGNMGAPVNGPNSLGNIEDGQDHEVRFVWNPTNNSYLVYFDGNLVISGVYDIINNCLGGSPFCYWGFTGSTGGAVNDQIICPVAPPPYPAGDEFINDVEICEGESYYAGGANQTTSGFYQDFYSAYNGCDSVINTNLTVVPASTYEYDAAVCQGDCETVGSNSYCVSGTYEVILPNGNYLGCDSIVTLNLTVLNPLAVIWPPEPITCFNPITVLDGSLSTSGPGTVTYIWTGPDVNCITSGDGTPVVSVNCPGIYTLTIFQLLGNAVCSASTTIIVPDNTQPPIADAGPAQNINCENACVVLDSGASSSGQDIAYSWTGPGGFTSGDQYPVVCLPGLYTLTVVNISTGCLAADFVNVVGNAEPPLAEAEALGTLTCVADSVILDGSNSSGMGNLLYEWLDENGNIAGIEETIDVENSGTYILIITDQSNGCTSETTVEVVENIEPPIADAISSGNLDCIVESVTLDGNNSSGSGNLEYEWLDEGGATIGNEVTVDVDIPGDYTLIITDDSNGCTAEVTMIVEENIEEPDAQATVDSELTCDNGTATLDGSGSNGAGTIEYEWFDENLDSIGIDSTIGVAEPGTYSLVITDSENGCTSETTVEVIENMEPPIAEASSSGNLDCIIETITLDGNNSSGSGSLEYEWLDEGGATIGNEVTVDIDIPGDYTLIITDDVNACTAEVTLTIEENTTPPQANAEVDGDLTCVNEMITLDGSSSTGDGTISFEWFDENDASIGEDITLEVNTPGDYTLIVTDSENGCTAETTATVLEDITPPLSDAGPGNSLTCDATSVTLDGTGSSAGNNIEYEWTNAGGVVVGNDPMVDVSETGEYTLVVTNTDNGCSDSSTVEVTPDDDLPTADAGLGQTLTCTVISVSLDGSGSSSGNNITYEWFDPSNANIGDQQTVDADLIGTYTLIVTNTDNGCTATSTVEVIEDIEAPSVDAGETQTLTCEEEDVTLEGNGGGSNDLSFEWFDFNAQSIGNSQMVTVGDPGIYTLIITNNENGCTAQEDVEVLQDINLPIADAGADGLLTCAVLNWTLDGSNSSGGSLTYEWQDSQGAVISEEVSTDVSASGVYTLIVTDTDNGCSASSGMEIFEDILPPSALALGDTILNCNISEVTLEAENAGATNLSFEWEDNNQVTIGTGSLLDVSLSGMYTLIVTNDDNGCTSSDNIEVILDDNLPIPDAGPQDTLTCVVNSLTYDASASSGNGVLSYEWLNASLDSIGNEVEIDLTISGDYTLIVTDQSNGCTAEISTTVFENIDPPSANAGPGTSLTCDQTDATLTGSGSSDSGDISFEWQNSNAVVIGTTATVNVSETGIFTLIVTDNVNGCTSESTVEVIPDANLPLVDAFTSIDTFTCLDISSILSAEGSISGQTISYEWFDFNAVSIGNGQMVTVEEPGIYTIVVTDVDNGCSASTSLEIFENTELPLADAGEGPTLTCDETTATLDGSASTGFGILTYEWTDPNNDVISSNVNVLIDQSGVYNLLVTAENGCTNSATVEVLLDADVPIADAGPGGILNCNINSIVLGGSGTSVGNDISYEWQDESLTTIATTATTNISVPGTYTLSVFNTTNNCITTASIVIPQDIEMPVADPGIGGTLTCTQTEIELGGPGTSLGAEYVYEWTNSLGLIINDDILLAANEPDTYTLLVTNTINECTAEAQVIVDQDIEMPVADAGLEGILTCDVTQIALDGSNSSGSNLSFVWFNQFGDTLGNQAVIQTGQTGGYLLQVTNESNGCTSTSMTNVVPDDNLPTVSLIPDGILTCSNNSVSIDGSESTSTSGNIIFEWQDEFGTILSVTNNLDVSDPGAYTLIVTDTDNGCSAFASQMVDQNITEPQADAGLNQTLTCDQTDATLIGTGSGGTNLSYEWLDDNDVSIAVSASVNVSLTGIYTFIVTNQDNGCSSSSTVEVNPDTNLPTAEAGTAETLTCAVEEVLLDAGASSTGSEFNYEWQDESGMVIGNDITILVNQPGTYTLFVFDSSNGCQAQDEVTVLQDINPPVAFIDESGALSLNCNTATVVLDGNGSSPVGNISFLWETGDGNILSDGDGPNPEVDQSGTYTLTITNLTNGCTSTESILVGQDFTPPVAIINNPELLTCAITETTLDASPSSVGNFSYSWVSEPPGGLISGDTTLQPIVNQPGIYTLTVLNNDNGCEAEAFIVVDEDITPPVAVASVEDEFDCLTENVTLDGGGSSSGAGFTYLWTGVGLIDNEMSLAPTVYQAGLYNLEVINGINGCTASSDVVVSENTNVPGALDFEMLAPECFGDLGSITIFSVLGGEAPYLYSLDGGEHFTNQTFFTDLDPGTYSIFVQDATGCEYEETIIIPVEIEVEVNVETDVQLNLGDTYQMNAQVNIPLSEIDTIIWSPTTGLSCIDCLNPRIDSLYQTTQYTVTVINQNGCIATDQILVRLQKTREIFIPNAFSPQNSDGINDVFMIYAGNGKVRQINTFRIFDRWGEIVFEAYNFQPNDPENGWNGRLRGEFLNPSVFVYLAEIEFVDNVVELYKGDVTLMR